MSVRVIAFGMVFILVGLFLAARLLKESMANRSKQEASYAEIIFRYKDNPTDESLSQCISELKAALGMSEDDVRAKLKHDGVLPKA